MTKAMMRSVTIKTAQNITQREISHSLSLYESQFICAGRRYRLSVPVLSSRWDCEAQRSTSLHSGRKIQDGAGHKMGGWGRRRSALRHHPPDPWQVRLWLLCARRYSSSQPHVPIQTHRCIAFHINIELNTVMSWCNGVKWINHACCAFRWHNTNSGWQRHIWRGEEVRAVQVSFLLK